MTPSRKRAEQLLRTDIYGITSESHSMGRTNVEVVRTMLDAGVRLIQYREKEKEMGEQYNECMEIRQLTRAVGAGFIVNDHPDLALMAAADGVHIGQKDPPLEAVRKLVGPSMVIGLSVRSPEQARDAVRRGADYLGVGPVYHTATKKDASDPVGFACIDYLAGTADIPFAAIGGIKAHNVAEVISHGASCVCLVSEIVGASDITATIKKIRQTITPLRNQS